MLDLHGWGDAQDELNRLSKRGQWAEMAEVITPEMLDAFAVQAPHDRLAEALGARYGGLADRLQFYAPMVADRDAWRALLAGVRAATGSAAPA